MISHTNFTHSIISQNRTLLEYVRAKSQRTLIFLSAPYCTRTSKVPSWRLVRDFFRSFFFGYVWRRAAFASLISIFVVIKTKKVLKPYQFFLGSMGTQ